MTSFRKALLRYKGLNLSIFDQGIVSGSNFFLSIYLTTQLGLADYGVFVLYWTAAIFLSSIQGALLFSPLLSLSPKQPADKRDAFRGSFIQYQALFSLAAWTALGLGVAVLRQWGHLIGQPAPSWLFPAAVALYLLQDFFRKYFLSADRPALPLIMDGITYGSQILLLVVFALRGKLGLSSAYLALSISYGLGIAYAVTRLERVEFRWAEFPAFFRSIWSFSRWLIGASILQWTSGNLFTVAGGFLLGPAPVGIIRASQNIVGLLHVFFIAMENFVPMQASKRLYERGLEAMLSLLRETAVKGGLLTLGAALAISLNAPFLLRKAYGGEMAPHGGLLIWFSALYVVIFFGNILRYGLRSFEATRPIFLAYLATTLFSVLTAYPLIRLLGMNGVMAGITGTQVIMFSFYLYHFRENLRHAHHPPRPG